MQTKTEGKWGVEGGEKIKIILRNPGELKPASLTNKWQRNRNNKRQ